MLLSFPPWPTLHRAAAAPLRPASRAAASALFRATRLRVHAKKEAQPGASDSKREKPSKKKESAVQSESDPAAATAKPAKKSKAPKKSADASAPPAEDNAEHLRELLAEVASLRAALATALAAAAPSPTAPAASTATPPRPASVTSTTSSNAIGSFPVLCEGEDDIRWMSFLHSQLYAIGYAVDEEERDGWIFGPSTREAVFTLQACSRPPLPETGVMDVRTWAALMAHESRDTSLPTPDPAWYGKAEEGGEGDGDDSDGEVLLVVPEGRFPDFNRPATSSFSGGDLFSDVVDDGGHGEDDNEGEHVPQFISHDDPNSAGWDSVGASAAHRWPPLRRDDGGRAVAALQALLEAKGYYCEEDEEMYWTFGLSTEAALRTFQACEGLSETGVADGASWRALAGEEGWAAGPTVTFANVVDDDKDMSQDGVWLLGEQRWERKEKLAPKE